MGCRLTERTSSLQDATNLCSNHITRGTKLYSTVIKGSDNIAKLKNLTNISSFVPSIDQQNPLPGQVKQSLPQKRTITKKVDVKVKTDFSKCTRKQVEMADVQSTPRKLIKKKTGSESFYAPTISSTLRLIASRDAKKAIKSCDQGAGAKEKKCNFKKNRSSISKVVPSRREDIANSTFVSSNRKLSGSQNARVSTSTTPKASRMATRSRINDLLVVVKPLEHSRRGATRGLPRKGSPHLSLREAMVAHMPATEFFSLEAQSCNYTEGTVEHLVESVSNLSLGRFNYHDRHREMRMDIDNMSYEELVELVEKIGSVSTGLSDEALAKCLQRSSFKVAHPPFGIADCVENGNTCSICQEECVEGEEIGALACEHWYHVVCIQQWLKQKNSCPICKSPACMRQ